MTDRVVRIGCGAGFWGDSAEGPAQLVRSGRIDYLVMDYLAEITMSLLARAKAKRPETGYASDFVEAVMRPLLPALAAQGIKVVTNAGGVNPLACKAAIENLITGLGLRLKVAAVLGDDLSAQTEELGAAGTVEMFSGAAFPAKPWSSNVYLGALPIAAALDRGADIVITGRCVDSALALGPLIHEFAWPHDDYDRLAAGSLAGHIIECGTQCTGGLFTDWQDVPGWDDMGFPIAVCAADGSFIITKPPGTGGLVSTATVAEQIVYEIGDPAQYLLPDVVCDFSQLCLTQVGPDQVRIAGARGRAPTSTYKLSVTYPSGYRATAQMMVGGREAGRKAARIAEAILARTRRLFATQGLADYQATSGEILGAESTYGPHARTQATREVILKLAVAHADARALEIFAREIYPAATAMAPGLTGFAGGRPGVQPIVSLFSCLVDKTRVRVSIEDQDGRHALRLPASRGETRDAAAAPTTMTAAPALSTGATVSVPLIALAHGRSGDKGDSANIGILARQPSFLPLIKAQLTAEAVAAYFAHCVAGPVRCFDWPGLQGVNFVLERALGGGGVSSLRHDPQGKAYAQMLLDFTLQVPAAWIAPGGPLAERWVA